MISQEPLSDSHGMEHLHMLGLLEPIGIVSGAVENSVNPDAGFANRSLPEAQKCSSTAVLLIGGMSSESSQGETC